MLLFRLNFMPIFSAVFAAADKQGRMPVGCQFVTPIPDKSAVNPEV